MRAFIERTFKSITNPADKPAIELKLRQIIDKAVKGQTLWTTDWTRMPVITAGGGEASRGGSGSSLPFTKPAGGSGGGGGAGGGGGSGGGGSGGAAKPSIRPGGFNFSKSGAAKPTLPPGGFVFGTTKSRVSKTKSPVRKTVFPENTVTIRVVDESGEITLFKVKHSTKMQEVFDAYAERNCQTLVQSTTYEYWYQTPTRLAKLLIYGGQTPGQLGLKEGDTIEVKTRMS